MAKCAFCNKQAHGGLLFGKDFGYMSLNICPECEKKIKGALEKEKVEE